MFMQILEGSGALIYNGAPIYKQISHRMKKDKEDQFHFGYSEGNVSVMTQAVKDVMVVNNFLPNLDSDNVR